jgi:hypothetical protein
VSAFEQVALALQAMLRTLRLLARPALWGPWLVLGIVQLGAVALLWGFAHPAVSWFMAPLLAQAVGPEVLRYPNLLRALPDLFGRTDLVIGTLFGSVAIGAATLLFADVFRGGPPRPLAAFAGAGRRFAALIAAQLPFNLIVVLLSDVLGRWLLEKGGGPLTRQLLSLTLVAVSVVVQSLFLYVAALVVLERRSALGALRGLPRTWARGFWAALTLGLALLAVLMPLQSLSDRAATLVDRGDPELVGWLVVVEIVASLVVWFLLAGSATLVYLSAMAGADSEARA